jgi:hypothetical protein
MEPEQDLFAKLREQSLNRREKNENCVELMDGSITTKIWSDGVIDEAIITNSEGSFVKFLCFHYGKKDELRNLLDPLLNQDGVNSVEFVKSVLYRSKYLTAYEVDSLITVVNPSLGQLDFPDNFTSITLPSKEVFEGRLKNLDILSPDLVATFSHGNYLDSSDRYKAQINIRIPASSIVGLHPADRSFLVKDERDFPDAIYGLAKAFANCEYQPNFNDSSYSNQPIYCDSVGSLYFASVDGRHRCGVLRGLQEFCSKPLVLEVCKANNLIPEPGRPVTVVAKTQDDVEIIEQRFLDGIYRGALRDEYYYLSQGSTAYCIMGYASEVEHPWSLARDTELAKELYLKSLENIHGALKASAM